MPAIILDYDPMHPGAAENAARYTLARVKPRVRLHVSVGKHTGALYWWFTRCDDPDPYSVLNQRHVTVAKAWQQFSTRYKLGLV